MRIPRYYGHRVDTCREGWRICLAMARVPGESLDSWLRKRANKQQQDGPSSVRRGCALAIALLRQLGPTLSRISSHVWHRDVNSHNILISVAEGSDVEDEEISNRVSFWLIDFGLAVEAQSWPQKWPKTDVAGDCRYWATSSFVMSFCGPEETAASPDFCAQYKTKLDIVGLGLTALELLCSTALASRKTWGPDGLRGSWERLLDTWERYREDVTRWHSMIFQVFTKGGLDASPRTIEKAWRQKARQHHPDKVVEERKAAAEVRNPNISWAKGILPKITSGQESFKRLSEAHDLLADPERRQLYDRFGIQDPNVLSQDQWDFGEGGYQDFADFEEILKEFFQNGGGRPAEPERDLQDVWEGILGFTLISLGACTVACMAYLARRPPLSGVLAWCWWRWRFLLFDIGFG
eukprot:symbB.v1.2.022007.t1/scaffold1935.1/size95652/2